MPLVFVKKVRFLRNESNCIWPLSTLSTGTYLVKIDMMGEALLSTLYIKSLGPGVEVKVDYFDFTLGGDFGEENPLRSHPLQNATGNHRQIVTALHNKPVARIIITGGDAELSLYGTMSATTLGESDANLVLDDQSADLLIDKARGIAGLDRSSGEWKILSVAPDGALNVVAEIGTPGDTYFADFDGITTPGSEQTLISYVVPAGKKLLLTQLTVSTSQSGVYRVFNAGSLIGGGRLGPTKTESTFPWATHRGILAGALLEVKFETYTGRPVSDLQAHIMGYHKPA